MNITFSNFSQTLNNISLLSGTTNTLSNNFNTLNSNLNNLSGTVNISNSNLNNLSGTVNNLSINFNTLNSNLNNLSGTVNSNSSSLAILNNIITPNNFGATLTSNNSTTTWSYEKYEKFIVDTNGNSFVLNNIPLTEVVFNLDYDTNYIFDVSVLSGVNLILSSTPFSSEQLASGYITSSGSNIILKIPRNYCNPIFLIDSNNINFGGNDYDKPYLNFGNYTTISGTRNTRNKDQLLCLGNTELYLPKGYEGYKINFNVLNGTTNYYTTNSDTIFGGAISGSISDGGVIAFYTNNNWFIK